MHRHIIYGIFEDEEILKQALRKFSDGGIQVHDVYTPFAVNGIDEYMGIKSSGIPMASFLIGFTAAISLFLFMAWITVIDWPINFGGKPFLPILSFIPAIFEFTILSSAIGLVVLLFYACRLFPSAEPHPIDIRATDDGFILALEADEPAQKSKIHDLLKELGALEIHEKEVIL